MGELWEETPHQRVIIETACPQCAAFEHEPKTLDEEHGWYTPMRQIFVEPSIVDAALVTEEG